MATDITPGMAVIRKGDAREGRMRRTGTVLRILPGDPRGWYRRDRTARAEVRWSGYRRIGSDYDGLVDILQVSSLVPADEAEALRRQDPTAAMLRTLEEWVRRVGAEDFYRPWDVFSERGNVATAHRNNCEKLIRDGLLVPDRTDIGTAMRLYRPKPAEA